MLAIRIGFMGAGRMATALRAAWSVPISCPRTAIVASDPSADARRAFELEVPSSHVAGNNVDNVATTDVIFLAVKPQQMDEALASLRKSIQPNALVISIAAGVTLGESAAALPPRQRIVRVMPNTPCLIGQGASGYALGEHAAANDGKLVATLLSAVGAAFEVKEELLDAVTGLSGSGPAFVYSMIEALTEGGTAVGLPAELAAELAVRTTAGAAAMVLETGETPAVLRERVTSPGGTTVAGLGVLAERRFKEAVVEAVQAAARRSAELGQATK